MPKTAGHFIKRYLSSIFPDAKETEGMHGSLESVYPFCTNMFTFGTIRNPWEWYVSFYHYLLNHHDNTYYSTFVEGTDDFADMLHRMMDYNVKGDAWNKDYVMQYMRNLDVGFCTFHYVYSFCNELSSLFNEYNRAQLFGSIKDKLLVDAICKCEHIETHLVPLLIENGINVPNEPISLQKINVSKHKPYQEYYTNDLIDLVAYKDEWLIKEYNYEYEQ